MKKTISIIIPSRNECKYLGICLDSLIANDYPHELLEILIVDGLSTDGTVEFVRNYMQKFPFIKLVENPDRATPFALNLGVRSASMEYVMIVSSHSSYRKDYIRTLLDAIDEFNADGVGGMLVTDVMNRTSKSLSIIKILSSKFGVGNSLFRVGVDKPTRVDTVPFGVYKKTIFDEVGYYNEKLIRNHDIEWSKRLLAANRQIYLIPGITCTYYARETFSKLAKNNYSNGKWNMLTVFITKNFSSLSLRHFVPVLFILSMILPALAGLIYWPLALISPLVFTIYSLSVIIISLKLNDSQTSFINLLAGFFSLHFSYGTGSLIGIFEVILHLLRIKKL